MNALRFFSTLRLITRIFVLNFILISSITGNTQSNFLDHFPDLKISDSYDPSPGYFFIATKSFTDENGFNYMAIFDNAGTPVYFKKYYRKLSGLEVQDDGSITFSDRSYLDSYIKLNKQLQPIDTFTTQGYTQDTHDFDIDRNGNYLLMANENLVVDMSEIIEGGNRYATVEDFLVQEFNANDSLLYTWKSIDHYNILDANLNSPYVNPTASTVDYNHANSICFDSDTSFLLSVRHFDEITKIDRRTGEIIWRLGGKNNEFEFINDTIGFSHQHTIRKLDNGNILLFDNGNLHKVQQSSVVEYEIDEINKKATLINRFYNTPMVFSFHVGGQQRIQNGNTLVYWGEEAPSLTEFHPDGTTAIKIDFSDHSFSNRIAKAEWSHEVFVTNTDLINYGMWDGYTESPYILTLHNNTDEAITISDYSTRTPHFTIAETLPLEIPANGDLQLTVIYFPETAQHGYITDVLTLTSLSEDLLLAQQVKLLGKIEDYNSPQLTISPDSSNVPLNIQVKISFNEPVRLADNTELNYENIDELFIFRKDDMNGADVPFNASINTDKTQIILTPNDSLEMNQLYYIYLDAILEDYSNNLISQTEGSFNTGSLTGIESMENNSLILAFPNPSSGKFTIVLNSEQEQTIEVYSLLGNLVYGIKPLNQSIINLDLSNQDDGVYLLVVKTENNKIIMTQKMILKK